jgi:hypothetical protein
MNNELPDSLQWVWNARWATYWYGDEELFRFTPQQFDEKARQLAEAGINGVLLSGFHFRWSFVDQWPQLLETMRRIVESCHRYDIKVVAHHSAILTFNPWGAKEWEWMRNTVDPEQHPGLMHSVRKGDVQHKGVWLSRMRQIDPRTGQFSRTNYRGWAMCFNNPLWRELYFEHLEGIYACGVDGIMSDDVQFWPVGYGCGCPYCRQAFHEASGYEMPRTGFDDPDFYDNMANPAYRAWILWRTEATAAHHRRVTKHFRDLGLELCRPFYSSSDTTTWAIQGLGGMVENVADLMSTIFTEVCWAEAQGHCWPWEGAEAKHRSALSYRTSVPPMCLFYPHNSEENLLCWALTKSWGQRYWPSIHGLPIEEETEMMRPLFEFEAAHPELYDRPQPISEVGVLFSAQTRNNYKGMNDRHYVREWCGWCETLMRANIPFDVITDPDLAERRYFDRFKVLILPNAAYLSDEQVAALRAFIEGGGKVIITHETGRYEETGVLRPSYPLAELVGADCEGVRDQSSIWEPIPGVSVPLSERVESDEPVVLLKPHSDVQVWVGLADSEYAAVTCYRYGQGDVLTFAGKPGNLTWIGNPIQHRPDPNRPVESYTVDYDRNEPIAAFMVRCVNYLLGEDRLLVTEGVPDGVLLGVFRHKDRTVVHLVNVAGTLANNHKMIRNPAPLCFPDSATLPGGSPVMTIRLRCPGGKAVLVSPEFEEERTLSLRREGNYAVVEIPSELVRCYSVVSII